MVRLKVVLLAAALSLGGLAASMVVTAESFRDLGTLASGAYLVQSDEGRFRVEALGGSDVVVYDSEGALVLARHLAPGEARTFALLDGLAVVALGGEAKLAAKGEGSVAPVAVDRRPVTLAEGAGPVDEAITLQLPPFLVGLKALVDGEGSDDLLVEVLTERGVLYRLAGGAEELGIAALGPRVADARVAASDLQGRVVLTLLVAAPPRAEVEEAEVAAAQEHVKSVRRPRGEEKEELTSGSEIAEFARVPVRLVFDAPGALVFDLDDGYALDASLFDASGLQVAYVHRGPPLLEAREWCRDFLTCWTEDPELRELPPERIEVPVAEAGTYLLYVRFAAVDGVLGIEGARSLEALEVVRVATHAGEEQTMEFREPLLDVFVQDWSLSAMQEITVSLNEVDVYAYRSTLTLLGQRVQAEESYDPSLLGAGAVKVTGGGAAAPGPWIDGPLVELLTVGKPRADDGEDDS